MSRHGKWVLPALAGVAALAGGLTALAFQRDIAAARDATVGRSTVIDSPWGAMEYAETGSGPPVLMIHGSGGGFDQALAFAAPLSRQGVRLIAPSRFGYLQSAFPEGGSPEMQADALAFLLDEAGIDAAVIIGGSAGALSAVQLALRHPERCKGLVLLVPAIYAPDRVTNESAAPNAFVSGAIRAVLGSDVLFWLAIRAAPDQMIRLLFATDPALLDEAAPAEQLRVRQSLFHVLPVSARQQGLLLDGATAGDPPRWPLENITCPVLAISARDDLYGTQKAAVHAAASISGARLLMFESGGHLWVGHDDDVWSAVAAFIREVESSG